MKFSINDRRLALYSTLKMLLIKVHYQVSGSQCDVHAEWYSELEEKQMKPIMFP
jgi:hypothetical protein